MADEFTINMSLRLDNGANKFDYSANSTKVTQTAAGGPTPGVISVGTSEESVTFGELTTDGLLLMQNIDATNYVQWGFSTAVYGGRMEAGDPPVLLRMEPGLTLYLKANTAACLVAIYGFED